jgi:chromosome segregation protein
MRIVELDLVRYGPFTNRTLTFAPAAKLHIIYGENEAGKSCSLAAVTDLLFGIEARTRYDFLHEAKDLRVGATVEARDGSRLTFQRRKGNKNTLLTSTGAALSEDALLPFLGSLAREVFCHAFGLNTGSLRAGAEEMLKSDGEVGASLFAAASGLRGLSDLRRTLEEEAEGIFAPRSSKDRAFYQALERFETARKAIRDLEVKAGDWKALNSLISDLGSKLDQIKAARSEKTVELARLARLKRVAPLVRQIDGDIESLAALSDLPELPAGFSGRLQIAVETLTEANSAAERANAEHGQALATFSEITVDETLIANSAEIQRLFGETAAYANDRRDISRVQAEADEYGAALSQLAIRLGFSAAQEIGHKQPTDAALALIRGLIAEGKNLAQAAKSNTRTIATEASALASLERRQGERGAPVDPRPWRVKLAAFAPLLKQFERRPELERAITAETRGLGQAAARLTPPVSDLDALIKLPLPGAETVTRFRHQLDGVAERIRRADEQSRSAAEAIAAIAGRLEELASGRPVASVDSIAAEREARDGIWRQLRAALSGEEVEAHFSIPDAVSSFEHHSAEADRLADAAATDAERVAMHSAESRRFKIEERKLADAKADLDKREAEHGKVLEEWRSTWEPLGVTPLPPTEMTVWLASLNALIERAEKRVALKDEIDRIDGIMRDACPALDNLACEIGLASAPELDASAQARRIESRLADITTSWDEGRDLETSIRDTRARLDKLRLAESETAVQTNAWENRWSSAIAAASLSPTATIDEAEAALLAWKEVPGTIRERDNRIRRVAGMQRNIDSFDAQADTLITTIASDLSTLPRDSAVKTLADRHRVAASNQARRDQSSKRLAEASRTLDHATKSQEAAKSILTEIMGAVPESLRADPLELLNRLSGRERLVVSLKERRSLLADQGDGFGEEQLRADLLAFDIDQSEAILHELNVEQDRLEHQAQEAFSERDRALREHAALEVGVGAEIALQQRRSAEAELTAAAHDWLVLKIGSLFIDQVVGRHRASQQDPLMTRAGTLFSTLTGGAYTGLDQDFDDSDNPRLVARRTSGALVPITGLSEGTRDQLYLALRLAYLEDYARHAEAAPFIGDDLFTSFDEERTASGLSALAAVGDLIQPILFTHHKHVVDIARREIGSDVVIIELN